jgi:hypothetical protein
MLRYKTKTIMHTWVINYNIPFVVTIWTVYNAVLINIIVFTNLHFSVPFVPSIGGNSDANKWITFLVIVGNS